MFLTEKEIMSQHEALKRTYDYMEKEEKAIKEFFQKNKQKKFVFLGCGSSYMLAKSAARAFAACEDTSAVAIAGGDYLVNPKYYANTVKESIIVTLSRSGQTTELVRDIKYIAQNFGCPIISLSMKADNDIQPYAGLNLIMDWCYDKSVCQTRTVTNLYTAILLMTAIYSEDYELKESVNAAVEANKSYKEEYRPILEAIAKKDWDNAIILADGANNGIAEEGALAFTEIAMLSGQCFNMLDYRHGPMVLNTEKTLTIMLIQPNESELQSAMVEDMKGHKGVVVTVSSEEKNLYNVDTHICLKGINRFEAWGIPFIYVMQMIAYSKSIILGRNPDAPTGLDAFITLK